MMQEFDLEAASRIGSQPIHIDYKYSRIGRSYHDLEGCTLDGKHDKITNEFNYKVDQLINSSVASTISIFAMLIFCLLKSKYINYPTWFIFLIGSSCLYLLVFQAAKKIKNPDPRRIRVSFSTQKWFSPWTGLFTQFSVLCWFGPLTIVRSYRFEHANLLEFTIFVYLTIMCLNFICLMNEKRRLFRH